MPKKTARRIIDERSQSSATSISGVTVTGSPSITSHSLLLNLDADDHLQYLRTDGTRTLTGNLGVAAGVTIDGVDISAHVDTTDIHIAHSGVTMTAGDGLTGGGTIAATRTLTLGTPSTLAVATTNALTTTSHTHAVTSSADVTAGGTSLLASSSGNLKLLSQNISSFAASNATFASGFAGSGWRVDYGVTEAAKASAEFDNLTIRGTLRVYELLIQQIRATNGSVFVSSASKAKSITAVDNAWTINTAAVTINNTSADLAITLYTVTTSDSTEDAADRSLYHGFLFGDVIRAQQVNPNGSGGFDLVTRVDLEVVGVTDLYTYIASRAGSTAPTVGMDFVRLGSSTNVNRRGSVYLTADDSNAPFIDIVDEVQSHSQWNAAGKIKARLGRLSGITDATFGTLSGYGLWSDNVYLTGKIYATDGVFTGTVYASAGSFTGAVTATSGSFTGTVTATTGAIGGWTLGAATLTGGDATLNSAGSMTLGTSNDVAVFSAADATNRLWIGHATAASAPFRVTKAGALTATGATISGALTATSGSFTGSVTVGTGGKFYGASNAFRVADTTVNLLIKDAEDTQSIRWVEDIDDSATTADLYTQHGLSTFLTAYKTSTTVAALLKSHSVNTGSPANSRNAYVMLTSMRNESGTQHAATFTVGQLTSTYSNQAFFRFTQGWLNIVAIGATPTINPANGTEGNIYVKGGNIVFMYNDGGTIRYKYMPLSGTSTTWTHSTTAP